MTRSSENTNRCETTWDHFHVVRDHSETRRVIDDMLAQTRECGWDDAARFRLQLAAEEAGVNAVKHGNQECAHKSVSIGYTVTDAYVSMMFEDEGSGFDPDKVPDPTDEAHISSPSGRGVFLIRNFMTTVEYNDKGNRVTMKLIRGTE